ncbi:MAG: hypothetical protein MUF42_01910 [Cytophagaceae bacterium]|jgi:hypothetical protein|nr:hypothetical protein [Cytophagaceae bacterium]
MSIELNKPEPPEPPQSWENKNQIATILIAAGLLLEIINLMMRGWRNPIFILTIAVGWCLLANKHNILYRVIAVMSFLLLSMLGGFWGIMLFHLIGLCLGIYLILQSQSIDMFIKDPSTASALKSALGKSRKLIRFLVLGLAGIMTLSLALFLVSREYLRRSETQEEVQKIYDASLRYKNATGNFPSGLEQVCGNDPLKREWLMDGWEKPYVLSADGSVISVRSGGSDGKFKTDDDIVVPNK